MYGLPRVLWLGDDERTLHMAPVPELERLRCNPRAFADVAVADGTHRCRLTPSTALSCEIGVRIDPGSARQAGLRVRTSPDGDGNYPALLRRGRPPALRFDATRGGKQGQTRCWSRRRWNLRTGEALQLRVFVDKSVIEVFANDRQAITRRVYPERGMPATA